MKRRSCLRRQSLSESDDDMPERRLSEEEKKVTEILRLELNEENLWNCVIAYQNYPFRTVSGLPFRYELKRGRNGKLNRELMIDRREGSKSLTWSSFRTALRTVMEAEEDQPFMKRPKSLGDVRGVSYIYPMFYTFGMIKVPKKFEEEMLRKQDQP